MRCVKDEDAASGVEGRRECVARWATGRYQRLVSHANVVVITATRVGTAATMT